MKRYFVKAIATATDENLNFKGEIQTYIIGKEERVYRENAYLWADRGWKSRYWAERYIQNDIDCERRMNKLLGHTFWTYQYEILEIEY